MSQDILKLWPTEAKFIRVISNIQRNGIRVDLDHCDMMHKLAVETMDSLTESLGFKASERTPLQEFLLDELKLPVVAWTDGGKSGNRKPSFNKAAMEEYDQMLESYRIDPFASEAEIEQAKSARKVLEFRGWQKADSACYVSYRNLVSPDGRIRPNFKMHGTKTGRLSCEKPNLQQIPRKSDKPWNGSVKQSFIPQDDGWELWEFDYKTLEFRLAALYANEKALMQRVNDGQDLHQATADLIKELTGIVIPRQDAKTTNFLILYGGGIGKLAWQLGCTEEKAQVIYEAYHAALPGVKSVMKTATRKASKYNHVKYWSGRKKHYNTRWNIGEEHKAFNALCQGGGAEMVKHSMVKQASLELNSRRMVLQVHDSVVWEIRKDYVEETIPQVIKIMSDWPQFPVKFDVDAHKWGEG